MNDGCNALPAYLATLALERNPFPQTPDADCYFRTESIERQFAETLHCVLAGKGFMLLTGEVGTGKSTFLRALMDELVTAQCTVAFIFNTFLQERDLLLAINRDFGLAAGADLAEDIDCLNRFLIEQRERGKTCVLVIDDAQNLDTRSLELLRLLSNLETRQNKLLQIVLSGQPELLEVLARPDVRQFASRVVQHTQLKALNRGECACYVDFRIARAGSDGRIRLGRAAQDAVHRHSKGNPRRVHLIMDRCMYGVLTRQQHEIDKALVDLAASEVGIGSAVHAGVRAGVRVGFGAGFGAGFRRPRRLWMLAVLTGLGIGGVAWTRVPSPQTPSPLPQPVAVTPAPVAHVDVPVSVSAPAPVVDPCLEKLGAAAWQAALQPGQGNGLNDDELRALGRTLAERGLALRKQPVDMPQPVPAESYCQWRRGEERWLLWRPAFPPFRTALGLRGDDVRWLQGRLLAVGLYTVPVDGIVGSHTLAALDAFQRRQGLPASGEVDAWTQFLLEHTLDGKAG